MPCKLIFSIFSSVLFLSLKSQNKFPIERWKLDSANAQISKFAENKDYSVYTGMYEILNGIQPVSYIGIFAINKLTNSSKSDLKNNEGRKGYIFESNLNQTFAIAQGRTGTLHHKQLQRLALSYGTTLRMVNDVSSPVLPTNQKIGLQYSIALWNNFTNYKDSLDSDRKYYARGHNWTGQNKVLNVIHLITDIMHYSNGRVESNLINDGTRLRNDYVNGDFSTNFISCMAVLSSYRNNHSLLSAGLGFQWDANWGGVFSFSKLQNNRYGKTRINGLLQYRSKPKSTKREYNWFDASSKRTFAIANKWSWRHRLEYEIITSNLKKYLGKKSRVNAHWYSELSSSSFRSMGFFAHLYYGRDYLNIRYDTILFSANFGLTFSLSKYKPPRQKTSEFIVTQRSN